MLEVWHLILVSIAQRVRSQRFAYLIWEREQNPTNVTTGLVAKTQRQEDSLKGQFMSTERQL